MNITNFVNAIRREFEKEMNKRFTENTPMGKQDAMDCFDVSSLRVVCREFDNFKKNGVKK